MHQLDSSNASQDAFIAKKSCVYIINIWMQHKIMHIISDGIYTQHKIKLCVYTI
jgi:hypothetical protein